MAYKPTDKNYLLTQLKNFKSVILDPLFLRKKDFHETTESNFDTTVQNANVGDIVIVTDVESGHGGASALVDLTDVNISEPTDGQALVYDLENEEWINGDVASPIDVIDNLESESTTDALSAKQGKVLNETKKTVHESTLETFDTVFAQAENGDFITIDDVQGTLPNNVIITNQASEEQAGENAQEGDFVVITDNEDLEDLVERVSNVEENVGDVSELPDPTKSVCSNVSELGTNLVANNQNFRFGYDSISEKYGYILKEADTDVFVPFKSGIEPAVGSYYEGNVPSNDTRTLSLSKGTYLVTYAFAINSTIINSESISVSGGSKIATIFNRHYYTLKVNLFLQQVLVEITDETGTVTGYLKSSASSSYGLAAYLIASAL